MATPLNSLSFVFKISFLPDVDEHYAILFLRAIDGLICAVFRMGRLRQTNYCLDLIWDLFKIK